MNTPSMPMTPQQKATAKVMRNAEERKAEHLRSRGWLPIPPEQAALVAEFLATRPGSGA